MVAVALVVVVGVVGVVEVVAILIGCVVAERAKAIVVVVIVGRRSWVVLYV